VVIRFLDVTGQWDPSLLFVMLGALLVTLPAFPFILKRIKPVCTPAFDLPTKRMVDQKLILGSVLFGIGWGLAGICPGPAVSSMAFALPKSFVFFIAMLAGMKLYALKEKISQPPQQKLSSA
jgi:uncharacterized membrane protein YedE/YeeE